MSLKAPPNAATYLLKLPLVMGFVCFVVGALMLFYGGFMALKSMDQSNQAEQNLRQLEYNWSRIANDNRRAFEVTKNFASSTWLLARTNLRVKLALCGVSLLTVAAGGVLLFHARPRQ